MNPRRFGLLELHVAVLLFGLAGLFGKLLTLPPQVIVFGRAAFGSAVLWIVWLALRRREAHIKRQASDWALILLSGAVLGFHWFAFFKSIQISTVAVGLLSFSTFPVFTTLLEPLVFRERLRAIDGLGALLVCAGLGLMVPSYDLGNRVTQGAAWGAASGLSFAVLALFNRRLVRTRPPVFIAAGQNLVAAVLLAPLVWTAAPRVGLRDVLLLAVLGVGCTALAHALFVRSLSFVRAQLASVVTGLEAVYGVVFAFLFLGEVPAWRTLAGGAVILGAAVFATLTRPAPNPEAHEP